MAKKNCLQADPTILFHRFQLGDEAAFENLYHRFSEQLYLSIRRIVSRQDVAEDIVVSAFEKLYKNRQSINEAGHIVGFLFLTARNEAISHLRHQTSRRRASHGWPVDAEYLDPREGELEWEQTMATIRHNIGLMSPEKRAILHLRYDQGLNFHEIAKRLNVKERRVQDQHRRAIHFLRQAFLF
ncbi:MAG TPA: sigma-70 family RNA polymerase sigma factor [Puia sp.]|jgi:RNA polymerase sigma-70 factor (ECF subfamily)|nr:sigma-70 family RNA polymerase sigma factor [Puia sp.]